jgi:hypothetical protein
MLGHLPDLFVRKIAVGISELFHQSRQRLTDEGFLCVVPECLIHGGSSSSACHPREG